MRTKVYTDTAIWFKGKKMTVNRYRDVHKITSPPPMPSLVYEDMPIPMYPGESTLFTKTEYAILVEDKYICQKWWEHLLYIVRDVLLFFQFFKTWRWLNKKFIKDCELLRLIYVTWVEDGKRDTDGKEKANDFFRIIIDAEYSGRLASHIRWENEMIEMVKDGHEMRRAKDIGGLSGWIWT